MVRYDGTMYNTFYDRHLIVTVSSEPGSPSSTVPEDKQIIPDDNIFNYEVLPGITDRIIRISVSIRVFMPPPNVVWPGPRVILFLSCLSVCPSVRPCVHPETLTRHLVEYLTHFHQTYINNELWDRGECIKFLGSF